jgi:hypothetical protein
MKYLLLILLLTSCASANQDLYDMGYRDKYRKCNLMVLENDQGTTLFEIMCNKELK